MKSLVTGGAGFIGSHLAQYLLDKGHEVIVCDDLSGGFQENVPEGAKFYPVDITDVERVNALFDVEKPDYVFHLAAYAAEGLSHFIRNFNYMNNLMGSVNLINASVNHNVKRFVFTSSMAIYGSQPPPYVEDMPGMPEDPYGVAKYAIECDLEMARKMFGLDYTIFRPHNVYGSKQHIGDSYRNVIGIFINQVMRGEPMTVFGDGNQTRAFSHINDVVPYIGDCIEKSETIGEKFNVGGDMVYSINNLVQEVMENMQEHDPSVVNEPPREEVMHAYSNHDKLASFFERKDPIQLHDGIKEMIAWAKSVGPKDPTRFEGVEILKGLPPKREKLLGKTSA